MATLSRMTYEDFSTEFAVAPDNGETDEGADVASAVYTAVDELLLDEVNADPAFETTAEATSPFACTDAVARDLLSSVSIQFERIQSDLRDDQLRVATFLASTMMRVVDTLATHPSKRPEPTALPRILALMQTTTRSQAPIEIRASSEFCATLQRTVLAEGTQRIHVQAQDGLPPGEIALSWAGCRASWRPEVILSQMIAIMRQFGLYADEPERSDDVR